MPKDTAKRKVENQKMRASRRFEKNLGVNVIQRGSFDLIFACTVLILFTFGIVMMYSASYAYAAVNEKGGANTFFFSQLQNAAIGFAAMAVISKINYKVLNGRMAIFAFAATIVILVITLLVNIGASDSETKRWIKIGGFQLQPSEFAKFTLILTLAYVMCVLQKSLRAPDGKHAKFTPREDGLTSFEAKIFRFARTPFTSCVVLSVIIVIYCGLVFLESHYSCTILLFFMGVSMMWLSGTKRKYFGWVFLIGAIIVMVVLLKPEILGKIGGFAEARISAWLSKDPSQNQGTRYQTVNGLYAIGSGGLFGVGLGNSKQKQLYIPEPQNDFIFPVICEELGFIGAAFVIILFAFLIYRGIVIAVKCKDYFGSLLVMGIMIQVALQVIINIAVVTDLFPNTGMPLPFFSYGGTALLVLLCEMGVVLSVSRNSTIEKQ